MREVRKVLGLARTGASAKERRANPFASQCEQGLVKLVEEQWKRVFKDSAPSLTAPTISRLQAVTAQVARTILDRNAMIAPDDTLFGRPEPLLLPAPKPTCGRSGRTTRRVCGDPDWLRFVIQ